MEGDNRFLLVAFTSPGYIADEIGKLKFLIRSGFDYIHLRKPSASVTQTEQILSGFSEEELSHIKLHDHFHLAMRYPVGGVHLNSRNPEYRGERTLQVSKSLHKIEEIAEASSLTYFTLSPIYPSISKPGYESSFPFSEFPGILEGKRAIALGGVTPAKIAELERLGFAGAAMLGYIWEGNFTDNVDKIINNSK